MSQAKAVALLGQRGTGSVYPNAPRNEGINGSACGQPLKTSAGSTWLSYVGAEPEGHTISPEELANVDVGGAFSAVALLPDTAAQAALDAKLKSWATKCPDESGPVDPIDLEVDGADSLLAYGHVKPKGSVATKYASIAVARTGNAQIICQLDAKDAATANAAAATCIQDMVGGANAIADPLSAPSPRGAKTLLASVLTHPEAKSEVSFEDTLKVQPPCGAMDATLMTSAAVNANFRPAGTDLYAPTTASAGVLVLKDPPAAKAMIVEARKTFGKCSGDYEYKLGPKKVPARVLAVKDVPFGDGGLAITDEIRFPNQKPEQGYTAIFSVGPFVIQVDQWQPGQGEVIAKAIADAAL